MTKIVLVYGGSGAVGAGIVNFLLQKGFNVIAADLSENKQATHAIKIDVSASLEDQGSYAIEAVSKIMDVNYSGSRLSAVLNAAGGWSGGNLCDGSLFKNVELMWKQSVFSSIVCAKLSSVLLEKGGLLVNFGANAAQDGTPGMIAYGMAKSAVHQLTKSLNSKDSGLPENANAVAVLPVTIDTENNRRAMPSADYSSWTPIEELAVKFYNWIEKKEKVHCGLISVITSNGHTSWTVL